MANTANYHEQGGERWVIGGELEIVDGARIRVEAQAGETLTADGEGGAVFRRSPAYVVITEQLPGEDYFRADSELTNLFEMTAGVPPQPGDRIQYRTETAEAVSVFVSLSLSWNAPVLLGEI